MKLKIGDICLIGNKRGPVWDLYEDKRIGIIISDVDKAYGRYVVLYKNKAASYPKNLLQKIN